MDPRWSDQLVERLAARKRRLATKSNTTDTFWQIAVSSGAIVPPTQRGHDRVLTTVLGMLAVALAFAGLCAAAFFYGSLTR